MVSGMRIIPKNDPAICGNGSPTSSGAVICNNDGKCGNQRSSINCNFCGRQGLLGNINGCMGIVETPSGKKKGRREK